MNTDSANKTKLIAGAMAMLAISLGVSSTPPPANALPAVQAGTGNPTSSQIKSSQIKSKWSAAQWKAYALKSQMLKVNQQKTISSPPVSQSTKQ